MGGNDGEAVSARCQLPVWRNAGISDACCRPRDGLFERQISLEGVEEDKAQADFKNGVLTVTLPKSEQSNRNVKHIAINAN